jgi:hypothetical protein
MNTISDRYILSRDRWSSSRLARDVGPYINPSKLPVGKPSILRDIKYGTAQYLIEFKSKHWIESLCMVLITLIFSGASFLYWEIAFWAAWEKMAWSWCKSGELRPPAWHKYYAYLIAFLWALVFSLPTLFLFGFGFLIQRSFL